MKYLITSALPYINGIKHLGNLVGCLLPSDVYAKYLRLKGEEVLYVCGTDEHGTPAEIAAKKEGITVEEYCKKWHNIQKDLVEKFGVECNYFGRTSDEENIELTQYFAEKLKENGFIEERTTKQVFSVDDNMYLADRYIEGTCPKCGSNRARGDQCDACGTLLDPTDLINPYSVISKSHNLEIRETKHLFLKQSLFVEDLKKWIENDCKDWPDVVKTIALDWLNSRGLEDRCITRDLKWGVPVKGWEGLENKVFYVWFDAPIAYLSMSKKWSELQGQKDKWKEFWYDTKDVKYMQFMGKDNVPFHAINFPVTILGSKEPWKLVDYIKGVYWLNYYNDKFSTSRHYGIFMNDALETYPADYWRYYLMSRIPENKDANFTWEDFAELINKDLADVLGNFINRVFAMIGKNFENYDDVLTYKNFNELDLKYIQKLKDLVKEYNGNFDKIELRKTANTLRNCWALGNEYITETQPWTLKNDKERLATVLNTAMIFMSVYSIISEPFITNTARNLQKALNIENFHDIIEGNFDNFKISNISKPETFFKKITDEEVEENKNKFGYK